MKSKVIWSLIAVLMIFFTGCNSNNEYNFKNNKYSFNDPDVTAYINGEPVYGTEKEQYIFMAKQYYLAIVEAGKELEIPPDDTDVFYQHMLKKTLYSDVDWDSEYYKTFLNEILINELVKDKDAFSKFVDMTISTEMQKAKDKIDITLYNASVINYGSIIGKVADHFNLTYDECVEKIYKPFIKSLFLYDSLFSGFVEYKYQGQKIEWDGSNKDKYVEFLLDAYSKYDEYIGKFLSESEIVLRP